MWEKLQSDMYFKETYENTHGRKTILMSWVWKVLQS